VSATWFEQLTGFAEAGYAATRAKLSIDGHHLVSAVNGERYGIGVLSMPTLTELRSQTARNRGPRSTITSLIGDARALHSEPEFDRATIQVASQFNVLEMAAPSVTPEDGVTRYQHDPTQGPACAIAAGAATIYRNYFAEVDGQVGQTNARQLDTLAPLGAALARRLGRPVSELWTMQNGYALCSVPGLTAISELLSGCSESDLDELRGLLAVGLHRDVQVTDVRHPGVLFGVARVLRCAQHRVGTVRAVGVRGLLRVNAVGVHPAAVEDGAAYSCWWRRLRQR